MNEQELKIKTGEGVPVFLVIDEGVEINPERSLTVAYAGSSVIITAPTAAKALALLPLVAVDAINHNIQNGDDLMLNRIKYVATWAQPNIPIVNASTRAMNFNGWRKRTTHLFRASPADVVGSSAQETG